jgi:integrase
LAGITDLKARNIKPGETLYDTAAKGLKLIAGKKGGRGRWEMRFTSPTHRRSRDMGLGSFPEIGIAAARKAAFAAQEQIAAGIDPVDARKAEPPPAPAPVPTFGEIAKIVVADAQAQTKNAKVAYQWDRHLGPAFCGPLLNRRVDEIKTTDVAAVLKAVWTSKPEIARKLLPAIRRVFEHARILLRDKHSIVIDNPARWDDLKAMGFQPPQQLTRGHFASLPHERMPEFVAALRERDATAARMLEFTILTNVRTGAALAATWDQIDLESAIWSVPIASLKDSRTRKEAFRIPLSPRSMEIIWEMKQIRANDYVFPGNGPLPLSNMAMLTLLKRMRSGDEKWLDPEGRPIVVHGFRATFRTWAEEAVAFPHHTIEEAMGHAIGSAVERAYRRTDLLEQRRALMNAWAAHCEPRATGNVIPFVRMSGEGGQ